MKSTSPREPASGRPVPLRVRHMPVVLAALLAASALATAACRSQPPDPSAGAEAHHPALAVAPSDGDVADAAGAAPSDGGREASEPDGGPGAPTGFALDDVLEGAAFTKQIQAASRVAACVGDDAWLPSHIDPKLVDKHCAALRANFAEYKAEWLDVAVPFIAKLRPEGLPTQVVYPFGGGDLVHALATYPDATEITTISLEIAGDVRGIDKVDNRRLNRELATLREHLGKLFLKAHSRTENLGIETRGAVPGEVAFTMAALAIHGFEPVTLRYFRFAPDGSLRFLSEDELTKAAKVTGRDGPFANAEIRFRRPGDTRVRVLRHVAYDLSDKSLKRAPALLAHLDAKKKVSAMTKAASHLLWDDEHFAIIREWLMTHTDWMISDTTGVPPRIAKKYGFVQDLFGVYEWPEPFGPVNNKDAQAFHDLFKGGTPIAFRYGYPDNQSHGHIVVTRKPDVGGGKP